MSKITPFVLGGLIGAGAAIMLAPKAGDQMRSLVAEKANALWGEAKDFGANAPASAQEVFSSVLDKGADILKDAPGKIQDIAGTATKGASPVAAQDSDELREKIEAARKRIAAQVKENAEQSKPFDVAAAEATE